MGRGWHAYVRQGGGRGHLVRQSVIKAPPQLRVDPAGVVRGGQEVRADAGDVLRREERPVDVAAVHALLHTTYIYSTPRRDIRPYTSPRNNFHT